MGEKAGGLSDGACRLWGTPEHTEGIEAVIQAQPQEFTVLVWRLRDAYAKSEGQPRAGKGPGEGQQPQEPAACSDGCGPVRGRQDAPGVPHVGRGLPEAGQGPVLSVP